MRTLLTEEWLQIPDDVTVTCKSRHVAVKGPKGEIKKDFSHLPCEMQKMKVESKKRTGTFIRIRMWFGGYRQACSVKTLKSHISNMITGTTEGFRYKMRLVHAHFPINVSIAKDGKSLDVKNFLGERHVKTIPMLGGTKVHMSADVKDELVFDGIDNDAVSLTCARINQVCKIGRKDERKFLDGIFVSNVGLTNPKEE